MAAPVLAPDSSVLVAGFVPEHPFHQVAVLPLPAVKEEGRLISHAMAEAYAILTGHTYGHPPTNVLRYLSQFLGRTPVGLAPASYPRALKRLVEGEIGGGAIYDGLIAATAEQAGLRLLSLDRGAARTYAMLGADYEILI